MSNIDEARAKFQAILGNLEIKPDRLFALTGDGKSVVDVPGQIDYIHVRLEDGSYYGVVFNGRISPPVGNGVPIVIGYSHEQPDLLQVLEVRASPTYNSGAAPGAIANVTGLAADWQQDDCLITWTALPYTPLLHNYRVTIDGVDYRPTTNTLLYTRAMNQGDHSDVWDSSLSIEVVAVDVYGGISVTPDTITTTWTRPTMPDCTNGSAAWNNDDVLFRWDDIVKPYTFSHYLVTVITSASIAYVAATNYFLYTNEMNRIDNGGLPDTEVEVEVVAVDRDGYTSFVPLVINGINTNPTGDTVHDEFDTYGGEVVAQNGSAGLHWLMLNEVEGGADETYTWASIDANHHVQGSYAALGLLSAPLGLRTQIVKNYSAPVDFTQDGRFTDDDFITLWLYADYGITPYGLLVFWDNTAKGAAYDIGTLSAGQNFLSFKRSDLSVEPGFDWSNVDSFELSYEADIGANVLWVDDIRIAKADPDNASAFNDTGTAWDFTGGVWHIYQDVPNVPYALGQIDTAASTRKTAVKAGTYVTSNHAAGGVYLREAGAAGLLAITTDGSDGYEVKLDSAGDTVKLLRWTGGVSTELASVATTINTLTAYYLGLARDGDYLRVFLSNRRGNIFSAENLIAYIEDTTYLQGKLGFAAYGANTRFFQVRGGSPEHALTAEFAYATDQYGHTHTDMPGPLKIGDVGGGDYVQIAADGSLTYHGDATFHLDEKGVLTGARITSPSSKIIQDDAESAFYFKDTATTSDYLWLNVQLNHDRKHGAVISPHLHWWQTSSTLPNWLIQYRYQKQGAAKTTAWTSAKYTTHAYTYTSGTLCQITDFGDFSPPSGDGVSDVVQLRIVRDTGNASGLFSGADGLTGDVYAYDFDLHKECDSPGSREEYIK